MTLQALPGQGYWVPSIVPGNTIPPAFSALLVIDASTEIAAIIGDVHFEARSGSKNISKVHVPLGAVTAGGTPATFRVSLQDEDVTSGPPARPDAGVDQSVTAATNTLTANATNSFTLGATRSVAFGERVAVVFDYSAFTAGDSVVVRGLSSVGAVIPFGPTPSLFTGTWAGVAIWPNLVLEFDDGSFGTLGGCYPAIETLTTKTFKQDTATNDEFGLRLYFPHKLKIDGFWAAMGVTAGTSDFTVAIVRTSDNADIRTLAVDANTFGGAAGTSRLFSRIFAEIELAANTEYVLSIRPTQTTNTVTLLTYEVDAAGHLDAAEGGQELHQAFRADLNSTWTFETTKRPFMGVRVSALDDGAGGAGVQRKPGNMRGGF